MSSTALTNSAGVPATVTRAFDAFASGQLDLVEVQQIMAIALQQDQSRSEAIHELLDEELNAQRVTISEYGELIGALGSVASENVPTECSEDAPDESGVYRVMDAGQMVRAERTRSTAPETVAVAAGNGLPDDSEFTKPLTLEDGAQAPAVVTISAGHVLRERFRLDEEVARGSMGVVYRATDLMKLHAETADPQLAIKLVSPAIANNTLALRAFQSEVASTQHLSHPNIVHLFDLDRDGDTFFITMEWLEGESLADFLDRHGSAPAPGATAEVVIEQLCAALSYAHEHGVVHADVKPGNVFLTQAGEVKLIDFGVAKSAAVLGGDRSAGMTPVYASCERLEQAAPTERDDLYSLACLIYRLLTGRRVFGALTALEAEARGLEPQPIGALSGAAWQALRRALAYRADDRQSDVAAFARQFIAAPDDAIAVDPHTLSMPPELADVFDDAVASQTGLQPELRDTAAREPGAELTPLDIEWELAEASAAPAVPAADIARAPETAAREPEPTWDKPFRLDRPVSAGEDESLLGGYRWVAIAGALALFIGALAWLNPRSPDSAPVAVKPAPAAPAPAPAPLPAETPEVTLPAAAADAEFGSATSVPPGAADTVGDGLAVAPVPAPQPEFSPPAAVPADTPLPATEAAAPELPATPVATAAAEEAVTVAVLPAESDVPVESGVAPDGQLEPLQLEALLSLETAAGEAILDGRLESPLRDNAVYYVDKMRAIDATDQLTQAAATSLAAAFVAQAEEALGQGEAKRALYVLDLADQFGAPESLAAPLRQQAVTLAAEYAAAAAAAASRAAAAEAEAAALAAAEPVAPEFDPNALIALSDLEFVNFVEPRYPRKLSRAYSGWVDMQFRVDAEGRTSEIVVMDMDLPDSFAQPSIDAISKWRFKPYEFAGEPVAVLTAVRLRYEK